MKRFLIKERPRAFSEVAGGRQPFFSGLICGGGRSPEPVEGTLIALSIAASTNSATQIALERLKDLKGCEVHLTHMPTPRDEAGLRRLAINLTSDPNFVTGTLFVG